MDGAAGREAVVEWLRYLRDIGVRELRSGALPGAASAPGSAGRAAPPERPAPSEPRTPPERPAPPARGAPAEAGGLLEPGGGFDAPPPADPAARLAELRAELGECTRCKLHGGRTNIVWGVGDPGARLMFVGEGPGADEDRQGEPFVGRAGRKLDDMIRAIGLSRELVYIANVVKCRPPNNRAPEHDEVAACGPFLFAQIEAIRPRVIVTLGASASKLLLGTRQGITRLRGQWQSYCGIPVMPTFHPAYLLRSYTQDNRQKVWDDLRAARARMDEAT